MGDARIPDVVAESSTEEERFEPHDRLPTPSPRLNADDLLTGLHYYTRVVLAERTTLELLRLESRSWREFPHMCDAIVLRP